MDEIRIDNLEVYAHHGVFPEENALGQKFVVCADLYTSIRRAGLEDALEHSIDYGAVSKRIKRFMEENTCMLIESVAEKLAAYRKKATEKVLGKNAAIEEKYNKVSEVSTAEDLEMPDVY